MSIRASFIIPVLDEEDLVAGCLQRLRQRYPASELIVVDGGSGDDTVRRALPHCDQLLLGARGRAAQMNLGAGVAGGDYLFFLHVDSEPGFGERDLDVLLAAQPCWGFSRVRLSGDRPSFRVIECAMNLRSRLTAVATGDQLLFAQRAVFLEVGGFDDIPLMEDVALCKRLRRIAAPHIIGTPVVTSSRRWEQAGVASTVLRMWALRLAYFLGVPPGRLWRFYYGR